MYKHLQFVRKVSAFPDTIITGKFLEEVKRLILTIIFSLKIKNPNQRNHKTLRTTDSISEE